MPTRVVPAPGLDDLIGRLRDDGYRVVGPTVRDQAIVFGEIGSCSDLPGGITDTQSGGSYRLTTTNRETLFDFNVGPTSAKKYLFPSSTELLRIRRTEETLEFVSTEPEPGKLALFGVRACEIAAIDIQDRVFMGGSVTDPTYSTARENLFIVGVNCGKAGQTCFCVSMDSGPGCTTGYDLVITEFADTGPAEYMVASGTRSGAAVLGQLGGRPATEDDEVRAQKIIAATAASMGRTMETSGLRDFLVDNPDHPRWAEVANRCLTCGNCTMACPTCFCSTTEDRVTLDGEAVRSRVWDSCFSLQFTGLHGKPVRSSVESRYRQWMTHKLATWQDQFGSSGCVGCGRCITWCPVGIDITEEVAAMRERTPVWTSNT